MLLLQGVFSVLIRLARQAKPLVVKTPAFLKHSHRSFCNIALTSRPVQHGLTASVADPVNLHRQKSSPAMLLLVGETWTRKLSLTRFRRQANDHAACTVGISSPCLKVGCVARFSFVKLGGCANLSCRLLHSYTVRAVLHGLLARLHVRAGLIQPG